MAKIPQMRQREIIIAAFKPLPLNSLGFCKVTFCNVFALTLAMCLNRQCVNASNDCIKCNKVRKYGRDSLRDAYDDIDFLVLMKMISNNNLAKSGATSHFTFAI